MNSFILFIRNFFKNNGHFVFGATLLGKITGFISSLLIVHFLSPEDFGWISIVNSLSLIFISLNGLGSHQILLRYGSVFASNERKDQISSFVFKQGFYYEICIAFLFLATSLFYAKDFSDVWFLFFFFFVRLFGFYFFNHIICYLRVKGDNRDFSVVNNTVNIGGLIGILFFSYFFGIYGYLIAIAIAPFLSLIWFHKVRFEKFSFKSNFKKQMLSYGFFSVLTALLSDLLFSLDIILLGFLLNEISVAEYRIALLIPSNMVFLSAAFLQSDYPILAKNYKNKSFVLSYIKNYYKLFLPICVCIIGVSYILKSQILKLFFGIKYENLETPFMIGVLAFSISMLSRTLFGNLVSALGEMKFNTIASIVALIVLCCSSFVLVPHLGISGMALSMLLSITSNGIALMMLFHFKMRHLKS